MRFNYVEYLSRHNRSKHWVDDVNNRRHDPIGLEQVWNTNFWETRQFTFICSMAEANSMYSRGRASQGKPTPQLAFSMLTVSEMQAVVLVFFASHGLASTPNLLQPWSR